MIPIVVNFVKDIFGEGPIIEIEGGDSITRNEGRRMEDIAAARSFLEYKSQDLLFRVIYETQDGEVRVRLPAVFNNPDYVKVLRNRFRELNRVEIQYWQIDFLFRREGTKEGLILRFTVRCGTDY